MHLWPEQSFSWTTGDPRLAHLGDNVVDGFHDSMAAGAWSEAARMAVGSGLVHGTVGDAWTGALQDAYALDLAGNPVPILRVQDRLDYRNVLVDSGWGPRPIPVWTPAFGNPGTPDPERLSFRESRLKSGLRTPWRIDTRNDPQQVVGKGYLVSEGARLCQSVLMRDPQGWPSWLVGIRRDGNDRHAEIVSWHDDRGAADQVMALLASWPYPVDTSAIPLKADVQRSRTYLLDDALVSLSDQDATSVLSLEECSRLVQACCEAAGFPDRSFRVRFSKGTRVSAYALWEIALASSGRNAATVIHESAHGIIDLRRIREAGHGPAFVAELIALHCAIRGVDPDRALDAARRIGLEVAELPGYARDRLPRNP